MSQPKSAPTLPISKPHPGLGCLVRVFWMGAGNLLLVFAAWHISERRGSFWAWDDALFWATAAALVLARLLDVAVLKGDTTTGAPATMAHWKRYALVLAGASLVIWGIAHIIAWPRGV